MKGLISAIGATALVAALTLAQSAPAQAITYRNGVVEFRNQTDQAVVIKGRATAGYNACVIFRPLLPIPDTWKDKVCKPSFKPDIEVRPGQSAYDTSCCTTAGMIYSYYFGATHLVVTAKLCTNHGLYGYTRIVFWKGGITNDTGPCP